MYVAILGRLPSLGMAELERVYGPSNVRWFSDMSALVSTNTLQLEHLGGTQKAGQIVEELTRGDWRSVGTHIVRHYAKAWSSHTGKLTLGISAYGFDNTPNEIQKTGIVLKKKLRDQGVSVRLIPNADTALSSATSHHNKLGLADNKIELIAIRARNGRIIIAESTGAQNITALARRDQARPKRDAFVGMLPPKLAQIMINLAIAAPRGSRESRLLDPFCGTGVVLQEALLMGYDVYGTDLSDKMIDYTQENLKWLKTTHYLAGNVTVHQGDAMTTKWQQPITAVVCETYLGQPFSAPPSPQKLKEVRSTCDHITRTFLTNIASQLPSGTPLCLAIPAWRDIRGSLTHLPFRDHVEELGFQSVKLQNIKTSDLVYYRESQVVARELLMLVKA